MTDPAICRICGGSELEHSYHAPHMVQLVAAVDALEDRLAALEAERIEMVALLESASGKCDRSDDGDYDPPCWDCRRRALLKKLRGAP